MTEITFYVEDKAACCMYLKIEAKGHARYDVPGKDIVCAAISTAMHFAAGLLDRLMMFDGDFEYHENEKEAMMTLLLISGHSCNDSVAKVCSELEDLLRQIASQYPAYVCVTTKYVLREEIFNET